jgi:hypothetical protein
MPHTAVCGLFTSFLQESEPKEIPLTAVSGYFRSFLQATPPKEVYALANGD